MATRRKAKAPTVGFVSLGCPKAASDAEQILTRLRAEGYEISGSYTGADLVVVNTCGFIDAAVEESLDVIGEALAENGKVIVTGCLGAKKDAAGNDVVRAAHPKVLAVTGPHALQEVMAAVHLHLPPLHDPFVDLVPPQGIRLTPDHYAYLKISEGCNHRCSFCIIPSLRGDLVSRPVGEVLREAEVLAEAGVRELLVISQDTSAYGMDVKYRTGFSGGKPVKTRLFELCRELGELGLWVRLHYVYPYPSVDDLIPLMAAGKILPYLDVPFQHASQRILKLMKRPASAEKVLDRIAAWRREVPDLSIRSTFITGFPGETEAEFNELLDFLDEAQLDRVGAFSYSPVAGASANELPGALPEALREERKARLLRHQEDISTQRLERKIGRRITVLVDDIDEEGAVARSEGDAPDVDGLVYITDGHDLEIGEFAEVSVIDCDVHDLYATLAEPD
ncbi:MAG: 30S ribosomal protein S12 methylthiotransferase RimO [Betaproteobacteria bacterium]|nr:30S ribosomal protein S12 methylthiotransferase RimO [Rhodocyclales bacterium]